MAQGKAGDIRAGGSYYEIYAKDGLSGVIATLKGRVLGFASFMQRTGAGMMAAGAGLGAGPLALIFGGQDTRPVEMTYALDRMKTSWTMAWMEMQRALVPVVEALVPLVVGIGDFARENAGLVRTVAYVAAGLFLAGKAMFLFGTAITIASVGAKVLGAVLAVALTPLGLVATGLIAVGAFLATGGGQWQAYAKDAGDALSAVGTALARGDIEAAFGVIVAGLKLQWGKFVGWMRGLWADVVEWIALTMVSALEMLKKFDAFMSDLVGIAPARIGVDLGELRKTITDMTRGEAAMREKQLQAELDAARARLRGAIKAAETPASGPHDYLQSRVAWATRGAFNVASAGQQFGIGSGSKMLQHVEAIDEKVGKLAAEFAIEVAKIVTAK